MINAGAGTYEPSTALAVEPGQVMIAQPPPRPAPAVCAAAEHLPARYNAADATGPT